MCIHAFYIFTQCGHSFFSPAPLLACPSVRYPIRALPPLPTHQRTLSGRRKPELSIATPYRTTCEPRAHPYRSTRVEAGMCLRCETRRAWLLQEAQSRLGLVTVKEGRWRVTYDVPGKAGVKEDAEGGWAVGGDLDMKGMVEEERSRGEAGSARKSARSSGKAARVLGADLQVTGATGVGPNLSPTSWKTSHASLEGVVRDSTRQREDERARKNRF